MNEKNKNEEHRHKHTRYVIENIYSDFQSFYEYHSTHTFISHNFTYLSILIFPSFCNGRILLSREKPHCCMPIFTLAKLFVHSSNVYNTYLFSFFSFFFIFILFVSFLLIFVHFFVAYA